MHGGAGSTSMMQKIKIGALVFAPALVVACIADRNGDANGRDDDEPSRVESSSPIRRPPKPTCEEDAAIVAPRDAATTVIDAADAASAASAVDAAATTDAAITGDAAPPMCGTDHPPDAAPPPPSFDCDIRLVVDQLLPTTCAVVDPVSHRVGRLRFVCAGGPARLTLGDLEIDGVMSNDTVELSLCREDAVSWLSGHYETIHVSADLVAKRGVLSFSRATGLSCPRVFTDCNATTSVSLLAP
jgi:hypothetical protein